MQHAMDQRSIRVFRRSSTSQASSTHAQPEKGGTGGGVTVNRSLTYRFLGDGPNTVGRRKNFLNNGSMIQEVREPVSASKRQSTHWWTALR